MKRRSVLLASASIFTASFALSTAAVGADQDYILATASTGGTYYPVGVAISTLAKVKLQPKHKFSVSAISSAGSGENIRLLRENEAQFAILQGLFGYYAASGTGPLANDGPQPYIRSVSMLWQNVEHFLVSADLAKTGTADDLLGLKGKTVAMGAKNSGTIGSNGHLLGGLGVDLDKDVEHYYAGYGPSADALQNGQVAGAGIAAGVPASAVTKLMASGADKVRLLTFTADQITRADDGANLWTAFEIPAGTYPNQTQAVTTLAQPNFLATHENISEEHVYLLTKAIYENLPFLNAIHPATKAMAIEKAISGLPAPLHPGAAKFYQEQGINIPTRLIAK
ncbi:MAG: TAXI family TRAP transporter solute-binding subunit [Gammaproteobacteria bacterium]|nr:TAXI family TRAP transporter solute-binding subunit [Gammaproteobacteria bacterium]